MNHQKVKISILISVVLASLALANFAFAQPAPPTTNPDIIPGLNTDGWTKAQGDKTYCLGEFKDSIFTYSNKALKTIYDPNVYISSLISGSQHCYIVLANAPDNVGFVGIGSTRSVQDGTKWRPYDVVSLEVTIKSSPQGILKSAVSAQAEMARKAKIDASGVSTAVGWVLDTILGAIAALLGVITALAGSIFSDAVGQVLIVTDMPSVVNTGWAIVRDVCNMFFILVLIVLALAAILRLEKYDYKTLLGKLILMAILVNFSKVIAVTIMNAVNFLASIFYVNNLGSQILSTLWAIINPLNDSAAIFANGWQAGLGSGLGKIILMIVAAVVFIALAGMFVIRLVGLYVLIIFSPVAYVASILPGTEEYAKQWWSHFFKYLIWAPVALFMIRLTMIFVQNISSVPGGNDSAFKYFIICAFLAAAFLVAKQAGMVGSDAMLKWGAKGGKALGGFAARTYSKRMGDKAFSATEAERQAKQGKISKESEKEQALKDLANIGGKQATLAALQAEAGGKRKDESDARASGETELADIFKVEAEEKEKEAEALENQILALTSGSKVAGLEKDIATFEHQEEAAKRSKRNYQLAQFLNPIAVMKGWHERSEELDKRAYGPAAGFVFDALNKYMPTEWGIFHGRTGQLGKETEHGFMGRYKVLKEESEALKGINISKEWASHIRRNVGETGTVEDVMSMELKIVENKNQDDFHNLELGTAYSPFIDLQYSQQHNWNRMTTEEKRLMGSGMMETSEKMGSTRNVGFFDEDRGIMASDLSYMQDPRIFAEEKAKIIKKFKEIDPTGKRFQKISQGLQATSNVAEIESNPQLYEAVVSSRMHDMVVRKQKRGGAGKWIASMEPASVRLQTPHGGWEGYTDKGLLEIATLSDPILKAWGNRIHEGETRALVYGGAMIDPVTQKARIPNANDGVYWEAWQDVVRVKPALAAGVFAFINGKNAQDTIQKVESKQLKFNADGTQLI